MSRVTIYQRSEFFGNVVRTEARYAEITRRAYAQYRNAIEIRLVKRGCRKEVGRVETYRSSLLVLEGWDHPEPAGLYDESTAKTLSEGVSTVTSRYAAYDERWQSDFDALIARHIAETGAKVLWDSRNEVIS